MSFQDTITTLIDHFDNSSDFVVKIPVRYDKLCGQIREITFAHSEERRKMLLELNKSFIEAEFRKRIENKYDEKKPLDYVIIYPNRERNPKKIEIVVPKKETVSISKEVVTPAKVEIDSDTSPKKPVGIQPYEARSEVEEQVFKSDKLFTIRDYMFGPYILSESRNLSEEELQKMGENERFIMNERLKRFKKEVRKLEDRLANPIVMKDTRSQYVRYNWETEQFIADKEREKQDAEEEKRRKTEFIGTSKKEEEISYKKFLEKISQVKPVTMEEMRETSRKFDERFAKDIKESRLVEIFDVEEVTGDENGTREIMNREEFREFGKNEGAMWAPIKLELLKEEFGYEKYEGGDKRKKLLETKKGLIRSLQMQCKIDIPVNGRSKKKKRKKLDQTIEKIDEINVELTNTWKEEIPKIAEKDVKKATFICKTMIETWKAIGRKGWKFITTVKLKKFLTNLLFEIIWNITQSNNKKDIGRREDDLLYKWYLLNWKEIEDNEFIEDCVKFEELLVQLHFIENRISGEFVELRKTLDSRLSRKQKESLFGWEVKERFKLGGEEILDESDVFKIRERRVVEIGSGRNRNRMAVRNFKKKKKKEELLNLLMYQEDFIEKKLEEEAFNGQFELMDARKKWMSNKTRKK
jgi:hypothetical protein